jgi:DNA-nicking Smr family endonuclease
VRRGRYPVAARLDLHGLTQAEAHRALCGFIALSRAAGRRCILVITGHGRLSGGVLRASVPRWLAEPSLRRHILAIAPARPQDGGNGALYVLLRRLPIKDR